MPDFKMSLDNAIKARDHAISKSLLPKEAIGFIDLMLDAAIATYKDNNSMAKYKVVCAHTLIRYFVDPVMSEWDSNRSIKEYLLTNQLPE